MQNENKKRRFAGRGYYIALIACIAAVGISGYVFVRTARNSAVDAMGTLSVPAGQTETQTEAQTGAQTGTQAPVGTAMPSATAAPRSGGTAKSTDKSGNRDKTDSSAAAEAQDAFQETDLMEDAYEETLGEATVASAVMWPIQGDVLATFSRDTLTYSQTMADWRTHEGLDVAADYGSLVCATQDGTVTAVYEDDFLGNVVVVSHSGDLATLYANLADGPAVAVGDKVLAGEVLGQVGQSALLEAAEPAHLHFEVFENGAAVDPMLYLPD